jgi:glycosyltransferase involved in cell wall biosynthesis
VTFTRNPAATDGRLSILLVTARYVPEIGGTELHTKELAERLVDRGHDVTVLASDRSRQLPSRELMSGVKVRRVRAWPTEKDYYFAPGILRPAYYRDADIVHVQGYHTFVAPMAMLASQRARLPYIVAFHSGGHSSRVRRAIRRPQIRLLRPLLRRARRLVASSEFELEYFERRLPFGPERFALVPVGVNLPLITTGELAGDGSTLVLSIGRLEEYKGHHRIIEALPDLADDVPNLKVRIVGDGPFEGTLRRMADQHGVSDLVEIASIPIEHREEMARLLKGAALVISLSEFESTGIAIREALGMRRRVLISDLVGYQDLKKSPLVDVVSLDTSTPELADRISRSLRKSIVSGDGNLPTWDDCVDAYEEIYRRSILDHACES